MNSQHPPIHIETPLGYHAIKPIRIFKLRQHDIFLVLAGEDFSDHDLWLLRESPSTATLVGTLFEPDYKKLRKIRHIALEPKQFDNLQRAAKKELEELNCLPLVADYVDVSITTTITFTYTHGPGY